MISLLQSHNMLADIIIFDRKLKPPFPRTFFLNDLNNTPNAVLIQFQNYQGESYVPLSK